MAMLYDPATGRTVFVPDGAPAPHNPNGPWLPVGGGPEILSGTPVRVINKPVPPPVGPAISASHAAPAVPTRAPTNRSASRPLAQPPVAPRPSAAPRPAPSPQPRPVSRHNRKPSLTYLFGFIVGCCVGAFPFAIRHMLFYSPYVRVVALAMGIFGAGVFGFFSELKKGRILRAFGIILMAYIAVQFVWWPRGGFFTTYLRIVTGLR